MKKSNIILIIYFSLFAIVVSLFLKPGEKKNQREDIDARFVSFETEIQHCRYIKVEQDAHLDVRTSDVSKIEYNVFKDSVVADLPYRISGDTLVISKWVGGRVIVYSPNLVSLVNYHAKVYLYLQQGDLFLLGDRKGYIDIRASTSIGNLMVDATGNSRISIRSSEIKSLSLDVDHSRVDVSAKIRNVKLLAKNSADVRLRSGGNIVSSCDSTCKFNVR